MKKSFSVSSAMFIVLFLATLVFFFWFTKSPYFPLANIWISQNKTLYLIVLYISKSLGIIWPPIPAGLITLSSIPFIGWFMAYMVDLAGSITGGIIAYHLAKKYGITFLKKVLSDEIIAKLEKIRIKKGREIEAIIVYRLLLGTTILEAVYYGAGLLKIDFKKFLIGSIVSHIMVGVPLFYLANNIFGATNIAITVLLTVVALVFVLKTKGRYLEQ